MKERVSILTESAPLAKALADPLSQAGFDVQILPTAPKYWQRARRFMSGLLVVDLDTMGEEALAQCRRLGVLSGARLMAVAEPRGEERMLEAFQAGVDEYMAKPVSPTELVARAEALLRRRHRPGGFRISRVPIASDVILDTDDRVLHVRGRRVKLTPTEYSVLDCLVRNAGQVVSRAALLRQAWGDERTPGAGSLNLYIYYLRRKIEHDPRHPRHIVTKWGVGYCLATEERSQPRVAGGPGAGAVAGSLHATGPAPWSEPAPGA